MTIEPLASPIVTGTALVLGLASGLYIGVRLGVRWALDRGNAAAERLGVSERWRRELAIRHHADWPL